MKYKCIRVAIILGLLCGIYAQAKEHPIYEPLQEKKDKNEITSVEELVVPVAEQITVKPVSLNEKADEQEQAKRIKEENFVEASKDGQADEADAEESEYADLAIAHVTDYVNVRSEPNTDSEILGKIYNGAVATVIETAGEEGDWFRVSSGTVDGYIKAEYFYYGQAAADVIDQYITKYAQVLADRLNVRKEPTVDSKRVGYLDNGERALLLEDTGEWMKVQYGEGEEGYVAAEYVLLQDEFVYAKSIEEERKELERLKALEERKKKSETQTPEKTQNVRPAGSGYSSNSELRDQIVTYAKQFLGNKYVHGGNSLKDGTDCSGFTSLIYADFGYSVGRTPASQLSSAGRGIDYSNIQKGDIICYGKNGKCTHVALYIGDGQIIHEANSRKGVVIYNADYDTILGVKNVID